MTIPKDRMTEKELYEICQAYRHTPVWAQGEAAQLFGSIWHTISTLQMKVDALTKEIENPCADECVMDSKYKKERDYWKDQTVLGNENNLKIIVVTEKVKNQNRVMREALEFYSDTDNWDSDGSIDLGRRARQAFAAIKDANNG